MLNHLTLADKGWAWTSLLVQMTLFATLLAGAGRLHPEHVPDTPSYVNFPLADPGAAIQQTRTYGYPVFLKVARTFGEDYWAAPVGHLMFHLGAVAVLMGALRAWGCAPWHACVTASGVLWANTQWRYVQTLAADSLALSCAIVTISCLLLLVRRPGSWVRWTLLGACLATAYHVRPAYVFLAVVAPLLAPPLLWLLEPNVSFDWRRGLRLAAGVVLMAFVPLLAYCGARWIAVGDFRLVAFEGYNACGVVGQFLDRELADELPPSLQPLAHRALAIRESLVQSGKLTDDVTTSYMTIESRFDANTWQVFAPAAEEFSEGQMVQKNLMLSSLARAIIRSRPRLYAIWLLKATLRGFYMIISELVYNPFVWIVTLAYLGVHFRMVWLRRKCQDLGINAPTDRPLGPLDVYSVMLLIAVSFACAKVALVVLTTPPLGRFMEAAAIFIPATLGAGVGERIGAARTLSRSISRA